jgi:arylsulfatase A-like enzyme
MRVLAVLALTALLPAPVLAADLPAKPNVVFILADDLGWTDLACQGSKFYETPNIDRLAREGMRFTNGYTCGPNCQPTRAALMSGQYGPRTGVYTVGHTNRFDTSRRPLVPVENVQQLPLDKVTVGEAIKQAGYATGYFGKWHLGNNKQHHPGQQGFDEALVSAGRHFDFLTQPPVKVPPGTYLADYLTDRAVGFLEKNKERPFFLYLAHFGVHSPHEAKKELIERFKDKPAVGGHRDPTYAAMIASVDESVGRVLKKLEELQLDKNTLVLFSSDNGGVGGYVAAGVKTKDGITNNAPLRGGKGMLYEGGIRVPWLARWPGRVQAGTVCEEPILSVDLYPTLLELAGGRPDPGHPLDGASLTKLLFGGGTAKLDRPALYWHFPGYLGAGPNAWRTLPAGAVRMGDWKLQEFFEDGRLELYNLRDDLGEQKNLAAALPERVHEMHARLKAWREEVKAPMPQPRDPKKAPVEQLKKKRKKGAASVEVVGS